MKQSHLAKKCEFLSIYSLHFVYIHGSFTSVVCDLISAFKECEIKQEIKERSEQHSVTSTVPSEVWEICDESLIRGEKSSFNLNNLILHQHWNTKYACFLLCRYLNQNALEETTLTANPQNREKLAGLRQALGAMGFNSLVSYTNLCYLQLKLVLLSWKQVIRNCHW